MEFVVKARINGAASHPAPYTADYLLRDLQRKEAAVGQREAEVEADKVALVEREAALAAREAAVLRVKKEVEKAKAALKVREGGR